MVRIVQLSREQQRLWAKGGGSEKLSEQERGRLIDIRREVAARPRVRRQEQAHAHACALDSSVQTPYSPSRARPEYRHGRAERHSSARPT